METLEMGRRTAKGKRDERMIEIASICTAAHNGTEHDDIDAVVAVQDGEYCVVEWTPTPNAAYSIGAQLRKKYTIADGWTIRAQKVSTDSGHEGGVIAARWDAPTPQEASTESE